MKERVLNFKVYLPQLESDPGKYKGGVKRYNLYKNEDSAALVLGGSLIYRPSELKERTRELDAARPKRSTNYSISPPYYNDSRQIIHKSNDLLRNNYSEIMNHHAFKQPKYTKLHPKTLIANPIVGYADPVFNLHRFSSLGDNGSKIIASSNKLKLDM